MTLVFNPCHVHSQHDEADEAPGCEPGDLVVVVREQAVDLPDKWRGVKKMAKW